MTNRALSPAATATNIHCTYSIFGGDWGNPGNTIDGNDSTYAENVTQFCDPTLRIDLGAAYPISEVRVKQDGANTVKLAYSSDDSSYTALPDHTPASGDETWAISTTSARYWHVQIPDAWVYVYAIELRDSGGGGERAYATVVI